MCKDDTISIMNNSSLNEKTGSLYRVNNKLLSKNQKGDFK